MRFSAKSLPAVSVFALVAAAFAAKPMPPQTFTTLYSFSGSDGAGPQGGMAFDADGNLYGTTYSGGNMHCSDGNYIGCGVVFKLDTAGHETVLHVFKRNPDGARPGGLIGDAAGNFYGTTYGGGLDVGTVFKVDAAGHETVLFRFRGGAGGAYPNGALTLDPEGNLYGTTASGGTDGCGGEANGCGVVFKLDKNNKETVLLSFPIDTDGYVPSGNLIRDAEGNLYGTTGAGGEIPCGNYGYGCGVVFKLNKAGKETLLHTFTGGADGTAPSGLTRDAAGNLYGTTIYGGTATGPCEINPTAAGCGTIFKLDPSGHKTLLYSFQGRQGGASPTAILIRDAHGNLYGVTNSGGIGTVCGGTIVGCGVVFKVDTSGHETVLHDFTGGADGGEPTDLMNDGKGNLYGSTYEGGTASCLCGTAFKITP